MESLSGSLKGRTAVVTGGSRGYGRGIVEALASRGMRVVVIARDRDRLAALRKEIPGDLDTIAVDATDAYTAATVVQRERPHLIVLNAGAMPAMRPTRLQTWETFSANWDTDVKHVFTWVREALLLPLVPGSTILIMSSTAAASDSPEISGYAAAKAALWRLSECLAVEAKPLGIRVVCLLPILSPATDLGRLAIQNFARSAGVTEAEMQVRFGMQDPLTPAAMGEAVLRILSDPAIAGETSFRVAPEGVQPAREVVRMSGKA